MGKFVHTCIITFYRTVREIDMMILLKMNNLENSSWFCIHLAATIIGIWIEENERFF